MTLKVIVLTGPLNSKSNQTKNEENAEKSFSQNVLKTNGWNLLCIIKVEKPFSYNQNFIPQGLFVLAAWAIYSQENNL